MSMGGYAKENLNITRPTVMFICIGLPTTNLSVHSSMHLKALLYVFYFKMVGFSEGEEWKDPLSGEQHSQKR